MAGAEPTASGPGSRPAPAQVSSGPRRFGNLERYRTVGSTQEIAADAARAGAPEGLVVVADEQLAGRGRRGRRWLTPGGSGLACSLLFRPALAAADLHHIAHAVALSALDALTAAGVPGAGLKWPNDLVVPGGKLGGLLVEVVAAPEPGRPPALVVGLGCNLAWPPGWPDGAPPDAAEALAEATTAELAAGHPVDRDGLLDALLVSLEERYRLLREPAGRKDQLAEYRERCTTIGAMVRVELSEGVLVGRASGIDVAGRLILESDGARRHLEVGDVVHLRTGP